MNQPFDSSLYIIVGLLPLVAGLLVSQANPYKALVIRGILGAIAALVYAILGAADVALTEALVGTMLAITLYAVAVRSSMVMRVGVIDGEAPVDVMHSLRDLLRKYQVRLETVPYDNLQTLQRALESKTVHGMGYRQADARYGNHAGATPNMSETHVYLTVRTRRLYDIFCEEMRSSMVTIAYCNVDGENATSSSLPHSFITKTADERGYSGSELAEGTP